MNKVDLISNNLDGIFDHEKAIKEVLRNFDFAKVHKCMTIFDWKWIKPGGSEVPSIGTIYQAAEEMLTRAVKGYKENNRIYSLGTGGLMATADEEMLMLSFVVTQWMEEPERR